MQNLSTLIRNYSCLPLVEYSNNTKTRNDELFLVEKYLPQKILEMMFFFSPFLTYQSWIFILSLAWSFLKDIIVKNKNIFSNILVLVKIWIIYFSEFWHWYSNCVEKIFTLKHAQNVQSQFINCAPWILICHFFMYKYLLLHLLILFSIC